MKKKTIEKTPFLFSYAAPGCMAGVLCACILTLLCIPAAGWALPHKSVNGLEWSCGDTNTNGKKILVAFDSKHGSTQKAARLISEELCGCGFQVDMSYARYVDDISGYDAVVAGSPIYWATFLPGIKQFLKKHETTLAQMPVAFFALSTHVDEETGLVKEETKSFFVDKELAKHPSITYVGEIGIFGGEFTLRDLYPVEVFSMTLSKYSDQAWFNPSMIQTWAQSLCDLLDD